MTSVSTDPIRPPPATVLHASGEMDLVAAPGLKAQLRSQAQGSGDVVVDLSAVTFMDCSALSPLLEARAWLGCRLWLQGPSPPVTRLLELTGLLASFPFVVPAR